jgi:hypothetical protein
VSYAHTFFSEDPSKPLHLRTKLQNGPNSVLAPETGTVGLVVSHVEIGSFIVFGCLSTYHPLLTRHHPTAAEEHSGPDSCRLESVDTINLEAKSGAQQLSRTQTD